MNRRTFVTVAGGITSGALAGCLGRGEESGPPPREATIFDDISISGETMEIALETTPQVESRIDDDLVVGAIVPIGTARTGSRSGSSSSSGSRSGSRGATGRGTGGYDDAPTNGHGWAIYGGYAGSRWRDDHDDEIETYPASIATLGVAYLGSNAAYRSDSPGPEPVPWDETWTDPPLGTTLEVDLADVSGGSNASAGWYRVGTHLESTNGNVDFDWQATDFKLERGGDGLTVDETWVLAPPL